MTSSKRRAILGGRFDPIHMGHIEMAYIALSTGLVDEVVFVPTADPPHKSVEVSYSHRFEMVKLAIEGIEGFSVADWERDERYAINTWHRHATDRDWYLLGSDSFNTILSWYHFDEIVRDMRFMIVPRLCVPIRRDLLSIVKAFTITMPCYIGISSTDIRRKLLMGLPLKGLLPDTVIDYIHKHNLYRR